MCDLTQSELPITPIEDELDNHLIKLLPNKKHIRLLFPYAQRQEMKILGAKWDIVEKIWYYPSIDGSLPEELVPYQCHRIHIEYDDKEFWKNHLPSMRWDNSSRFWVVNASDYQIFLKV